MNKWLNRAANLFLMLLCPACLLRLIQDSFHLAVEPKAYGWLALLCVLLWAAVFLRRCFFLCRGTVDKHSLFSSEYGHNRT